VEWRAPKHSSGNPYQLAEHSIHSTVQLAISAWRIRTSQLGMSTFGDDNIRWLDVPVDDPFGMRRVQSVGKFNRQREQNVSLNGIAVDSVFQRHAIQTFHGGETLPLMLADLVNDADVGWLELHKS
jgi:hypothetical protein